MRIALTAVLLLAASFAPAFASAANQGQQACYELYKPVCAAEQVECFAAPCYPVYHTYANECFAGVANAAIIHDGACTTSETGMIKPATTTPPVATSTHATPMHEFFYRFWHAILSWFR